MFKALRSDEAVACSGFVIGLAPFLIRKDVVKTPLTNLFLGCLAGICCDFGARKVDGYLPKSLRFLFPLLASTYCIHHFYLLYKSGNVSGPYVSFRVGSEPPPYEK